MCKSARAKCTGKMHRQKCTGQNALTWYGKSTNFDAGHRGIDPSARITINWHSERLRMWIRGLFPSTSSGNVFFLSCQQIKSHGGRLSDMHKCSMQKRHVHNCTALTLLKLGGFFFPLLVKRGKLFFQSLDFLLDSLGLFSVGIDFGVCKLIFQGRLLFFHICNLGL